MLGEETERVRGLATGVDGHAVKPFSAPELSACMRALLRAKPDHIAALLKAGDISLRRIHETAPPGFPGGAFMEISY